MNQVLGERIFQASDGSRHRIRVTRNHPETGRPVPGVRFLSFEDMEGRPLGVAGINASAATLELNAERLEKLLVMAGKCRAVAAAR